MRFGVLGPVELTADGHAIALPKPRSRAVLAYLLLSVNRFVTTSTLVDALWGERPPATARNQIQVDVSALRRTLRQAGLRDPITTRSRGYQISLDNDELDLSIFRDLRQAARTLAADNELSAAAARLRQALDLWRGQPLGDVAGAFVAAARAALTEEYLGAIEDWAELELRMGRHREVTAELADLARQHPLRENLARQLALALYADGRTPEALAVFRRLRTALADELGIDLPSALAELEVSMLRGTVILDSPTVAALPAVNMLPARVAAFIGRCAELRQLDALTSGEPALAVVSGSGGIGKTALVLHWAHNADRRFPDGLYYVDLCGFAHRPPLSPVEALSRLLHQLGVPPAQIPAREEFAVDLYRARLAGKRALVVLDNARDSAQVRPLLPGEPNCVTVVTSRMELSGLVARDGAVPIRLDVLSPHEAQELLDALLGPQDPAELDELARMCAYVPLALRIAAAYLRGQASRRIGDYLARTRSADRLRVLQLDGDDDVAMAATLRLSYDVLAEPVRRLFRLLSLVPGPEVTVGAAAALAGSATEHAETLLTRLAAAHLVEERATGRFGFHDLLRLFAARQAELEEPAAALAAARERLYRHYLSHVDAAARRLYPQVLRLPTDGKDLPALTFHSEAEAVAWLDAERTCLVAAVVDGCERGPHRLAWQLADALRGYFFLRMFTVDWRTVAEAALRAAQRANNASAEAAALLSLADLYWRQGAHDAADQAYARAIARAEQGAWRAGQATALGNLGGMRRMQGQLSAAVSLIEQSLALNIEIGRIEGQFVNLGNLGVTYSELGQWEQAEHYLGRAYMISQRINSRSGEAVTLTNLVECALRLGRIDVAEERARQALALHRELGDKAGEAITLSMDALVRAECHDLCSALQLADMAVALAEESKDERILAQCLHTNAAILLAVGDNKAAVDLAERSVQAARGAGHRLVETRALLGLARSERSLNRLEQALAHAHEAWALAQDCGYRELVADAAREIREMEAAAGSGK